MSIQPLNDQVLIQVAEEEGETETSGGIIIPKSANMGGNVELAVVQAVGEGRSLDDGSFAELKVSEGDKVYIRRGQGVEIVHEGTSYRMVHQAQLLAVLR